MREPIVVSEACYAQIEEWLEDYYETFPFKRIYRNGVRLGYTGFIENFKLVIEEPIAGVVVVSVVSRETGIVKLTQAFDRWTGLLDTPELQGHLL